MARFRFTLESITCQTPRSAGQYHDAVAVMFSAGRPGQAPDAGAFLMSPLGVQGPRWTCLFGSGYTHSLAPDPRKFGPGFSQPWSVELDLPESGRNRELGIVVINQRHVSDPYKVTKVVTSLALAAGMGVAGVGAGTLIKESAGTFVKAIVAGLGGVAGEGIKKFFEGLFGEWPECAGTVFHRTMTFSLADLEEWENPITLVSDHIEPVPEDCHQPSYTVTMSFKSVEPLRFDDPTEVVSRRYEPVDAPAKRGWTGQWSSSPTASPDVTVSIEPSRQGAIAGRADGAPGYKVTVRELVDHRNTRRTLVDKTFDPVFVESHRDLPYDGTVHEGKWKGSYVAPVDGVGSTRARSRRADGATGTWRASGAGSSVVVQALAGQAAGATLLEDRSHMGHLLRSIGSADVVRNMWNDQLDVQLGDLLRRELTPEALDGLVAYGLTEAGATLEIPDEQIVLRLYRVTETMSDGSTQRSTVLRYSRPERIEATRADYELARYQIQR